MLISTIMVAALLLLVALVILADACRPMLSLNLDKPPSAVDATESSHVKRREPPVACIVDLSEEDREGFFQVWHSVQKGFATDPRVTIVHADLLISDLIQDGRRPALVEEGPSEGRAPSRLKIQYRSAHEIAIRSKEGYARPAELNRALKLYSDLFDELLGMPAVTGQEDSQDLTEHRGAIPISEGFWDR